VLNSFCCAAQDVSNGKNDLQRVRVKAEVSQEQVATPSSRPTTVHSQTHMSADNRTLAQSSSILRTPLDYSRGHAGTPQSIFKDQGYSSSQTSRSILIDRPSHWGVNQALITSRKRTIRIANSDTKLVVRTPSNKSTAPSSLSSFKHLPTSTKNTDVSFQPSWIKRAKQNSSLTFRSTQSEAITPNNNLEEIDSYDRIEDISMSTRMEATENQIISGESSPFAYGTPQKSSRGRKLKTHAALLKKITRAEEGNNARWAHILSEGRRTGADASLASFDLSDPRCTAKQCVDVQILADDSEFSLEIKSQLGLEKRIVKLVGYGVRRERAVAYEFSESTILGAPSPGEELLCVLKYDTLNALQKACGGALLTGLVVRIYNYSLIPPVTHAQCSNILKSKSSRPENRPPCMWSILCTDLIEIKRS
jgi:hypothetical protein